VIRRAYAPREESARDPNEGSIARGIGTWAWGGCASRAALVSVLTLLDRLRFDVCSGVLLALWSLCVSSTPPLTQRMSLLDEGVRR
jgi:hypothetical protein